MLAELKISFVALIALSFVVFLGKAYENTLRGIDSNIHAKVSMNVTSQGILPQLPMAGTNSKLLQKGYYFNDHPFFYFWVNGWVMRAFTPSSWSSRILTATFSVGCVLLTYALGSLLYSPLFGFLSALFFLFTRDIILTGATVSLDPPMMFCILLSFVFWQKGWWKMVALTTGIGLWIKTPVVLLVYPTAALVSLLRGEIQNDLKKITRAALLTLFIGSWVWIVTGWLGGWDLVADYWGRQVWGTAVGGRNMLSASDRLMFFKMIQRGFLPGLPFLLVALVVITYKKLWKHPVVQISLSTIAVVGCAVTAMKFRMEYYYNPIFPFLALLTSFSLIEVVKKHEKRFYIGFAGIVPIALAVVTCCPITFGPEGFVALKRFMPLIQAYGTPEDRILLLPGGEPIGSVLDYQLVLNFYTERPVDFSSCELAAESIQNRHPQWIILSQENLKCLKPEDKKLFPTQYQVGNQFLLARKIPASDVIDLTPLDRELKPVLDGKPQPYTSDMYHRYGK